MRRRSFSQERRSPMRDRGRYDRERNFRMERERDRGWYNRDRNFNDNRNYREPDRREMDRRRMSPVDRRPPGMTIFLFRLFLPLQFIYSFRISYVYLFTV